MNFTEIAKTRQSCRSYDEERPVEPEKLEAVLASARLAPSACNCQPYFFTVCTGETAKEVALLTQGLGMNKFAVQAPIVIVVSEMPYGMKVAEKCAAKMNNDYRSIDIGITTAYLTAEATAQGLGTCIIGYFNNDKICEICGLEYPVRLVITLGYPKEDDKLRTKRRKRPENLMKTI